jgi:rhamnogalacturonyl hydrolase YesR
LLLSKSTTFPAPDNPYLFAVNRQLHDLLSTTPKYTNGAISHRDAYPSLWADFIYMVPPALAYYGIFTEDLDMVKESVQQCELYCEVLGTKKGFWRHIANAQGAGSVKSDDGAWCTSNAWAAAGMARVLATLRKSRYASETVDQQSSLVKMTKHILDGTIEADTHVSGLLRNYLDDETWFAEVAGTALMAATAFRMAILEPVGFGERYTSWAASKLEAVGGHIDGETGIVAPVVNSLKEGQRTPLDGINPEGQAFVVLLYAAWRDWQTAAGTA